MKPYLHRVQYYETDKMGVTHHSNYIRWMEEARIAFLDALGWSFARLEQCGIVSPVTAIDCKYIATTTFDDEVSVEVSVEAFNGVTLTIAYAMRKSDGTLCCTGHSEHCFLNHEGRFIRLKRDYPDFFAALTAQLPKEPMEA